MDLNFLVFPKPEFKCINDLFYTRLLFVPKRGRGIQELAHRTRGFSFKKPKDQNPDEDFFFPRDPLQDDMEGKPLPLRIMVKSNFLFGKSKPSLLSLQKAKKQEPMSAGFTDSNNTFEKPDGDEGPHIPAVSKVVRFPNKGPPKLVAQSLNLRRDANAEFTVPAGGIEIKKNLFQSSRQSIRIERNKEREKSKVTISKLMSDLDGFKKKKSSGLSHKTKTNLDKKFELLSKNGLAKAAKHHTALPSEPDSDLPCEELFAPQERDSPMREDAKHDAQLQIKCFLQRRSLNELNNKFVVPPPRFKETEPSQPTAAQPKLNIFFKHMPSSKRPNFGQPCPSKAEESSTEELPVHGSPQEKLSKYQRPQLHIKKSDMEKKQPTPSIDRVNLSLPKHRGPEGVSLGSVQSSIARNKHLLDSEINEHESIPCLLLKPDFNSDFVVLYFHANGEDIQQIQFICEMLKASLNVVRK